MGELVSEEPKYSFEDLEVYKKARVFRKNIYRLAKKPPDDEKFVSTNQMRRAAVSVTSNIAEGHGRFHFQENIQFLRQWRGSVEELLDGINVCLDENYAKTEPLERLKKQRYDLIKSPKRLHQLPAQKKSCRVE